MFYFFFSQNRPDSFFFIKQSHTLSRSTRVVILFCLEIFRTLNGIHDFEKYLSIFKIINFKYFMSFKNFMDFGTMFMNLKSVHEFKKCS